MRKATKEKTGIDRHKKIVTQLKEHSMGTSILFIRWYVCKKQEAGFFKAHKSLRLGLVFCLNPPCLLSLYYNYDMILFSSQN